MPSPTIPSPRSFSPIEINTDSKLSSFYKLLSSYVKDAQIWIPSFNGSWIPSTISECNINKEKNSLSISLFHSFEDSDLLPSYAAKNSFFSENKNWSVLPSKNKNSLNLLFSCSLSDVFEDKVELPALKNPSSLDGIQDLTNLSHLNGPSSTHEIYTYSGVVLVALNPYYPIDYYGKNIMSNYLGNKRANNEPHLYALAEDAYSSMSKNQSSQSIIIYGESGAGKTTSAKHIMRYFAQARHKINEEQNAFLETQILATNPVFEAFGNAKTVRNDNSSRFGKYLEIFFDFDQQTIIGADNKTFLLERSRLTNLPESERNYHIFYQLLAGADPQILSYCKLQNLSWSDFRYLSKGKCGTITNINDADEFINTCNALELVGIGKAKQLEIWKVLAALLYLGNTNFENDKNSKVLDSFVKSEDFINASSMLGLDPVKLKSCLVEKKIVTQRESISVRLNKTRSSVIRHSIAKFLYSKLFDWILEPLNASLNKEQVNRDLFIGILDIYGFEYFESNSFEQLCINYANEKLQHHFNNHVFESEQQEYKRENLVNWDFISFHDNRPCIELLEGKIGIFSILDEESRLETGTDENFLDKIYQLFGSETSSRPLVNNITVKSNTPSLFFSKPRFSNNTFIIHHYACDVTYNGEGFLDKNRDSISHDLLNLLGNSSCEFVTDLAKHDLLSPYEATSDQKALRTSEPRFLKQSPTLGAIFRKSLAHLIKQITSTEMHFIRCIKTNAEKKAWLFEPALVTQQLYSCGILETIKISKAGYPSRVNIHVFNDRYLSLIPIEIRKEIIVDAPHLLTALRSQDSRLSGALKHELFPLKITKVDRNASELILKNLSCDPNLYQIGLTKVFFRSGLWADLEFKRTQVINGSAITIQKNIARFLVRKGLMKLKASVSTIQKAWITNRLKVISANTRSNLQIHSTNFLLHKWSEFSDMEKSRLAKLQSYSPEQSTLRSDSIPDVKPSLNNIHNVCGLPFDPEFLAKFKLIVQELYSQSAIRSIFNTKIYHNCLGINLKDHENSSPQDQLDFWLQTLLIHKDNVKRHKPDSTRPLTSPNRRWSLSDFRNLVSSANDPNNPDINVHKYARKVSLDYKLSNKEIFHILKSQHSGPTAQTKRDELSDNNNRMPPDSMAIYCQCDKPEVLTTFLKNPEQYHNLIESVHGSGSSLLVKSSLSRTKSNNTISPQAINTSISRDNTSNTKILINNPWSRDNRTNQNKFSKAKYENLQSKPARIPLTANRVLNGVNRVDLDPKLSVYSFGKSYSSDLKPTNVDVNTYTNPVMGTDGFYPGVNFGTDYIFGMHRRKKKSASIISTNSLSRDFNEKTRERIRNVALKVNSKPVHNSLEVDNRYRRAPSIFETKAEHEDDMYSRNRANSFRPRSTSGGKFTARPLTRDKSSLTGNTGYTHNAHSNYTTPTAFEFGRHTAARAARQSPDKKNKKNSGHADLDNSLFYSDFSLDIPNEKYSFNSSFASFNKGVGEKGSMYDTQDSSSETKEFVSYVNRTFSEESFDARLLSDLTIDEYGHKKTQAQSRSKKDESYVNKSKNLFNNDSHASNTRSTAGNQSHYDINDFQASGQNKNSGLPLARKPIDNRTPSQAPVINSEKSRLQTLSKLGRKVSRIFS
ncbi:hypothetical protein BB560_006841 [Smittium megazygosporum]|uniref:Myosin motor domain-containing protein n=1 Tax=Smittium megazygosporum TaxID=133381 RepID=A0A2T9Y0Z5_9FUNG|nr:hypothetical protein BB560_006841 [Smittium megazygosporum]